MLVYTATSPLGPFTRNTKNVNFLNGSCYYSRFFRGPVTHTLQYHFFKMAPHTVILR